MHMRRTILIYTILAVLFTACSDNYYCGLTVIPPCSVSDMVNADVRAGIVNTGNVRKNYKVSICMDGEVIHTEKISLNAGESGTVKKVLETKGRAGEHKISLRINSKEKDSENLEIVHSETRSLHLIEGAWAGLYHWSETEGKHWNRDIRNLTDAQWGEMVSSMHKLGMQVVVIQDVMRNSRDNYVGRHNQTADSFNGQPYYPSSLYPDRFSLTAVDPVDAILTAADSLDMCVFPGIGLFAWFDFSPESLEWHKRVTDEIWSRYSHHKSLYGFYISEESAGDLYNLATEPEDKLERQKEIVAFFRQMRKHVDRFAPDKPLMLATNSMKVPEGAMFYPELLVNLDILCPFGFARMPEGDLSGKEAADMLQGFCDAAGSHLWFDLEAFLFNPDGSLYARPMEQIEGDLNLLDNFEKILCYQFPGVFNDPDSSFRVGEERTLQLFNDYLNYYNTTKSVK